MQATIHHQQFYELREKKMISRFDKIAVDLPRPKNPSANDAAAVQELLGGKFGEMSTLMNYTYQSFNFSIVQFSRSQKTASVLRFDFEHRRRRIQSHRNRFLRHQSAADRNDKARQRPVGDAALRRSRRAQHISFYCQRSDCFTD